MSAIKQFDEFVKENIAKKQAPNIPRAKFLIAESEKSYSYLVKLTKTMGMTDEGANSIIKLSYDIMAELIRAKMMLDGFNSSGQGAHEAEVAYAGLLGFSENEIQFLDQLRYFRNGVMYYGKILDADYARKVLDFLNKIYPKLKAMLSK